VGEAPGRDSSAGSISAVYRAAKADPTGTQLFLWQKPRAFQKKGDNLIKLAVGIFLSVSLVAYADEIEQAPTSSGRGVLPPGLTEEMLAPPPVPRFMLEKPSRPMTTEEMMLQARAVERKAGIAAPARKSNDNALK